MFVICATHIRAELVLKKNPIPSAVAIPDIQSISELRTNLNGICEDACSSQEPTFMTRNSKTPLVVIDCEAYERQQ